MATPITRFRSLLSFLSCLVPLSFFTGCAIAPTKATTQVLQMDFEGFLPSDKFTLPATFSGITYSANGPNYFALITDASKDLIVSGPRSQGIHLTNQLAQGFLRVTLADAKRMVWVSLIKTSSSQVTYSLKGTNGIEFRAGKLDFGTGAQNGTYRTFHFQFADPNLVKMIDFGGSDALLSRIVAADR